MSRNEDIFLGIDLGGARGKTTAVARLRLDGTGCVAVEDVSMRRPNGQPWCDEPLVEFIAGHGGVVAVNAPLTIPACLRCVRATCPSVAVCEDTAAVWLQTKGADVVRMALEQDLDRIAAVPSSARGSVAAPTGRDGHPGQRRLVPYVHRRTEVERVFRDSLLPRDRLGAGIGPIAARATHLVRQLRARGWTLNQDLIEVSPRATVAALCGLDAARGFKRDADPWHTRAQILEDLADLRFAPSSRLSREEVLRNDHCFEAVLSAYTGYLRQRDGWQLPDDDPLYDVDGFIWAPEPTAG